MRWGACRAARRLRVLGAPILQAIVAIVAASVLVFLMVPLSPGSPAASVLAVQGREVTAEAIAAKERELGLDQPLYIQFGRWFGGVVQGDLGRSYRTQQRVGEMFGARIGPTLLLGTVALALALSVSVLLALLAAAWPDRWPDHLARAAMLGIAGIPSFVLGLLVLQYLVVALGVGTVIADGTVRTVWLPAATLAAVAVAGWSRPLRALLLEATTAPYTVTAAARGSSRPRTLVVHALPNALVPFLGLVALGIGALIGGTAIVEVVYSWPGLGALVVESVKQRDIPVVRAFLLLGTLAYVLGSLTADLLTRALDPRQRRPTGVAAR
ncbi:MAG: ABC transporter permease [Egibacteraceae bacterium]